MTQWSLATVLGTLHDDIQRRLEAARKTFGHPGTKGDASEHVWLELFQKYLPRRYETKKAFVVDSNGEFSDQIDVVVLAPVRINPAQVQCPQADGNPAHEAQSGAVRLGGGQDLVRVPGQLLGRAWVRAAHGISR